MATPRLPMKNIREILRQKWVPHRTHRDIASSKTIGLGTITKITDAVVDTVTAAGGHSRPDLVGRRRSSSAMNDPDNKIPPGEPSHELPYELHIGLSRTSSSLEPALLTILPPTARARRARASHSGSLFAEHDVAGTGLHVLLTADVSTLDELAALADVCIRTCAGHGDVRVEGERILDLRADAGPVDLSHESVRLSAPCRPLRSPVFESHLSLKPEMPATTGSQAGEDHELPDEARALVRELSREHDQITVFFDPLAVVLTSFHEAVGPMFVDLRAQAERLAATPVARGFRVHATAERILFCVAPTQPGGG